MPREPLRRSADAVPRPRAASWIAAGHLIGANRNRGGIAWHENHRPFHPAMIASSFSGVSLAMGLPSTIADGAQAQSPRQKVCSSVNPPARRGLAEVHAEPLLGSFGERNAAHRLACLGPAQRERVLAARLQMEIVIEGCDAINLGARNVERLSNLRQRFLRNISELSLKGVKYRQSRAFLCKMPRDDSARNAVDCRGHVPSLFSCSCD